MADAEAELRKKIIAIQRNPDLTAQEKARKCQDLMTFGGAGKAPAEDEQKSPVKDDKPNLLDDDALKCTICLEVCERPVTAPCQHNFCLACFGKWTAKGNKQCPTCRAAYPAAFANNPRINTALAVAIRMARLGERPAARAEQQRIANADRPDEAFTTDRAVRSGRANAASGRIMVTTPQDHFGPIPPEHDPRGTGVRVGEWWKDRMDCRQWGTHLPHVAGIAGQSTVGAQSVVLSGGYEDDVDQGEFFLYTGSGGRDLSGNKRTNKVQSFDQKFESSNKALLVSCQKGLPVRVVRSHKEKRSAYAPPPETSVRYDGIYRIAACWRKPGNQGPLVCRYLFVRADNEPAPWSTDDHGDRPTEELPEAAQKEMRQAKGTVYRMSDKPWWGWMEAEEKWGWTRDPPVSVHKSGTSDPEKAKRKQISQHERALREFTCGICKCILEQPLCMPCNHAFCKPCLLKKFAHLPEVEENTHGRAMRVRHVPKPCPKCSVDIAPYLKDAAVNHEMAAVIERLQAAARAAEEGNAEAAEAEAEAAAEVAEAAGGATAKAAAAAGVATMAAEPAAGPAAEAVGAGGDASDGAAAGRADASGAMDGVPANGTAGGPSAAGGTSAAHGTAAATAVNGTAANGTNAAANGVAASDAAVLAAEFDGFDEGLIASMLEDQGGDVKEVRFYLQKMKNAQEAAAKKEAAAARKAAKAAAGGGGLGATPSPIGKAVVNGQAANGKAAGKRSGEAAPAGKAAKRQRE